jgi:NADH:ubiquinone oxidoreductase subunit F (NADH-binding)
MQIQRRFGYLPEPELARLAEQLEIAKARVWDVASSFPVFRRERGPEITIGVCRDMTCHLRGSANLLDRVEVLKREGKVQVEEVSCLGRCDRAPVVRVAWNAPGSIRPRYIGRRSMREAAGVQLGAIRSCIEDGPGCALEPFVHTWPTQWKMDVYARTDLPPGEEAPAPFAALRAQLDRPPDALIEELERAQLVGLGGALGRTGKKWRDVYTRGDRPKYVVANGDESEPGTFKDREVLLSKAHLVVEGVSLAGLVLGAERAFIFIRHEYEAQAEAIDKAIGDAKAAVPEAFVSFDLETFVSPGGYICGEQSALLEVIEGRRAQPRDPFPSLQTNGLFDRPTLVNNVETFAWVPGIALRGGAWYSTLKRRLFSISGDVEAPGVFEVPIDFTLGGLIGLAGGTLGGRELKAVAPSGPSGGFRPRSLPIVDVRRALQASILETRKRMPSAAERLERFLEACLCHDRLELRDLPLDGAIWKAIGSALGPGIVVYADGASIADQAINCLQFFHRESCGKCAPCRIGCQKLVRIAGILRGEAADPIDRGLIELGVDTAGAREAVGELASAMEAASICSLGRVAPNPLASVIDYFGEELTGPAPRTAAGHDHGPEACR